jgi:hypothetical protein
MDEKWKKWLFGSIVAALGGIVSYLTPLSSPSDVVWKTVLWVIIQKMISAFATLPAGTATKGVEQSGLKKWLARM